MSTVPLSPSPTLQPKSYVSDFGQSIEWPNSGKPVFGCKGGREHAESAASRGATA